MNWKLCLVMLGVIALGSQAVDAGVGGLPFSVWNRLRVEYDDNYDELESGQSSSFKVYEELELAFDINLRQSFIGINLRPGLVWWADRPGSSTDFQLYADAIFNHRFSRRANLSVRGAFRRAEEPELAQHGVVYRSEGTYNMATGEGAVSFMVLPKLHFDVLGSFAMKRHSDSAMSDLHDYDKFQVGTRGRFRLLPETELNATFSYETIDYGSAVIAGNSITREADTVRVSFGAEQIFSPNLMGSLDLGFQQREAKHAIDSKETSPYVDTAITVLPSPATRLTFGANYMLTDTDVFPYTQQERLRGYASLSQNLTAKLTLAISGSYTKGDYEAVNMPENSRVSDLPPAIANEFPAEMQGLRLNQEWVEANVRDRSENSYMIATALSYQINRKNIVEAGWRLTSMDSDLRQDFDRNVFHAGWRLEL